MGESIYHRKALRVPVNDGLIHPVPKGDADSVDPVANHLVEVGFSDEGGPVFLEGGVSGGLSEMLHAVELGILAGTAHGAPGVLRNPGLEYEERAEIHAPNLGGIRQPSPVILAVDMSTSLRVTSSVKETEAVLVDDGSLALTNSG